jgi:hypothetical protein
MQRAMLSRSAAAMPLKSSTSRPTLLAGGDGAASTSASSSTSASRVYSYSRDGPGAVMPDRVDLPRTAGAPPPPPPPPPAARSPTRALAPSRPRKVSLFNALKFAGPGPETINGRLAMAFLLYGASLEAQTDLTAAQLGSRLLADPLHWDPKGLALAALVVVASLVPITKGAISEPFGVFTPKAERVNGRAAMLAIAAIIALESRVGVPFF